MFKRSMLWIAVQYLKAENKRLKIENETLKMRNKRQAETIRACLID